MEYLLLLCVAVSSYIRKESERGSIRAFDALTYFDWEFERTAPALPLMEIA